MVRSSEQKRSAVVAEDDDNDSTVNENNNDSTDGTESDDDDDDDKNDTDAKQTVESETPGDCADTDESQQPAGKRCAVYILESSVDPAQTYVGFTVNMARRIRQHNGDLKSGGAKRTKAYRPWRIAAVITADPAWFGKIPAQQLEYAVKRCGTWKRRKVKNWHEPTTAIRKRGNAARRRSCNRKPLSFAKRGGIQRRLNALVWLLSNRAAWTYNAPVCNDVDVQKLTVRLAAPFRTPESIQAFESAGHWKPTVLPLPKSLAAVEAGSITASSISRSAVRKRRRKPSNRPTKRRKL